MWLTSLCQSPKFLVANICDRPRADVINCQFREFAVAPLEPVHFCRRTNSLELAAWSFAGSSSCLTRPNNLGGNWRRICLPEIRSASALEVFTCSRSKNRHFTYLSMWQRDRRTDIFVANAALPVSTSNETRTIDFFASPSTCCRPTVYMFTTRLERWRIGLGKKIKLGRVLKVTLISER